MHLGRLRPACGATEPIPVSARIRLPLALVAAQPSRFERQRAFRRSTPLHLGRLAPQFLFSCTCSEWDLLFPPSYSARSNLRRAPPLNAASRVRVLLELAKLTRVTFLRAFHANEARQVRLRLAIKKKKKRMDKLVEQ